MSEQEFRRWMQFYRQQPFDDIHRYYRPAVLQASAFGGGDADAMMDFLVNRTDGRQEDVPDADLSVFEAFGAVVPGHFKEKSAQAV